MAVGKDKGQCHDELVEPRGESKRLLDEKQYARITSCSLNQKKNAPAFPQGHLFELRRFRFSYVKQHEELFIFQYSSAKVFSFPVNFDPHQQAITIIYVPLSVR